MKCVPNLLASCSNVVGCLNASKRAFYSFQPNQYSKQTTTIAVNNNNNNSLCILQPLPTQSVHYTTEHISNTKNNEDVDNEQYKTVAIKINNNISTRVPNHYTILEACRRNNVYIPTLCNHPRLPASGVCRLCLVKTNTTNKLLPACVTKVSDGMEITTSDEDLCKSVQMNLELMLARHPNACMTCEANGKCEFQDLVNHYQIQDKWPKATFHHEWDDDSPSSIARHLDKCLYCGRCVQACSVLQGMDIIGLAGRGANTHQSAFRPSLLETDCIECGQCSAFCPVAAITPKDQYHKVMELLESKSFHNKTIVVQTAPAVRVAIGEEVGLAPGAVTTGQLVASLRALGFDYVFDSQFSADLTIVEEASELINRVKDGGPFPMFTSCCPAWVNLVEKSYPQYIPNLSTCKSPQQMLGTLIKRYFPKTINKDASDIISVSIMPCTAKKTEANREEFMNKGLKDVDYVLTTREFGQLLRLKKIPLPSLRPSEYDAPLGISTGAGVIFGASGGVMEAAVRTAYEYITNETLAHTIELHAVRGIEGVKDAIVPIGDLNLRIAVVNGTANARHLLESIEKKAVHYDFIEIMACPGGCIGGGGQPKSLDENILQKRIQSIYSIDSMKSVRKSHENVAVQELYKNYLGDPLGETAHHLLHTHYKS